MAGERRGVPTRMTILGSSTTSPRTSAKPGIAKENPKKLQDLEALFLIEAAKYNVLPTDSSFADRANPAIRPNLNRGRTHFEYYPGMIRIPEASAPDIKNKSFRITAVWKFPKPAPRG